MPEKPPPQEWHRVDIIAAIWKRGTSLIQLSRKHGYAPQSLHMALTRPWPKAEKIIAECIGVPAREIWPSRYNVDGVHKKIARRAA